MQTYQDIHNIYVFEYLTPSSRTKAIQHFVGDSFQVAWKQKAEEEICKVAEIVGFDVKPDSFEHSIWTNCSFRMHGYYEGKENALAAIKELYRNDPDWYEIHINLGCAVDMLNQAQTKHSFKLTAKLVYAKQRFSDTLFDTIVEQLDLEDQEDSSWMYCETGKDCFFLVQQALINFDRWAALIYRREFEKTYNAESFKEFRDKNGVRYTIDGTPVYTQTRSMK
jgi:hypothetical protein